MKYIPASEAVGKTVVAFRESYREDVISVIFTDDTYTGFEAYDSEIFNKDFRDHSCGVKADLGLITEEEHEEIQRKHLEELAEAQRQQDLREYNRLKAKFENQ